MPYKDPVQRKAWHHAYYQRTREHARAARKAWYLQNKPAVIANVAARRKRLPGARSVEHRSARYGLTGAEVTQMQVSQAGLCAICGEPPTGKAGMSVLHIDHDHATGQVRAMLCHMCNKGLGAFRDNPALLAKAAMYLTKHRVVGEVA